DCMMEMHIISTFFVFGIVGAYIYIYRKSLNEKNLELKMSYQKLVESEKMASLGLLSAGVAHEINNPLNFIKGGIEMLTMQLNGSKDAEPYVQAVDEGVKRVASIIDSLAHFSRDSPAMNEVCDIQKVIDNCLVMLNHKLKYKVELVKEYEDLGSLKIIGNEGQLHQAFLNILTNAEEAIDESGTINIRTYTEGEALKVTISDTGRGIDPKHINKINDLFFTTKDTGEGTGLGLSITYKAIEEHHGAIAVESKLGEGTSFHITFNKPLTFDSE
ncbi:MAG: ATP-binding protein, partial [Cytophagales bacterium]|nr:ATP-binding protein [Cytophagales bacterium]